MTEQEKIIASGFTGVLFSSFSALHEDVEKRMERPVFNHELGTRHEEIKELYREDFLKMCHDENPT